MATPEEGGMENLGLMIYLQSMVTRLPYVVLLTEVQVVLKHTNIH